MNSSDTLLSTFCYEAIPNKKKDQLNGLLFITIGALQREKASFEMCGSKINKFKPVSLYPCIRLVGRRSKLCNADISASANIVFTTFF